MSESPGNPIPHSDIAERIKALQALRVVHVRALEEIHRELARLGADGDEFAPPSDNVNRRIRGKFARTGEQSLLDFIEMQRHPSTAEINAHWKHEGRRGTANVTLLTLIRRGLIERVSDPTVRGSRYRLRRR